MRKISILMSVLCLVTAYTVSAQNLLSNGGFENGYDSLWSSYGTATIEDDLVDKAFGTRSLKVTVGTQSTDASAIAAVSETLALDSGAYYEVSFYAKSSVSGDTLRAILEGEGTQIGNEFFAKDQDVLLTSDWLKYSISGQCKVTGNYEVRFQFAKAQAGTVVHIDEVKVTEELVSGGKIDSISVASALRRVVWNGAATFEWEESEVTEGRFSQKVDVTTVGTNPWDIHLIYENTINIEEGSRYRLRYDAKASSAVDIGLWLFSTTTFGSATTPNGYTNASMTTEFETKAFYFVADTIGADFTIRWNMGTTEETFYYDNILIDEVAEWTGATDTDWATGSNWADGAVPASNMVVYIPSGLTNEPTLSGSTVSVRGLEIESGATLTIDAAALEITNSTWNEGTIILTNQGDIALHCELIGDGTIDYTNAEIQTGGRYSVIGSVVDAENTERLGTNAYKYDESVAYGSNEGLNRFVDVTGLNEETMSPGVGYFTAGTSTANFAGTPNHGDVEVPLSFTDRTDTNDGFNLISNPYPCAIDAELFLTNNANALASATAYVWDDNGSNTSRGANTDYFTVNVLGSVGSGSNGTQDDDWNGYFAAGQGFFVQTDATSNSVVFSDNLKVSGQNDVFFRKGATNNEVIKLSLVNKKGDFTEAIVAQLKGATKEDDNTFDAEKLGNSPFQIFSTNNDKHYAIQAVGLTDNIVDLGVVAERGNYEISFESGVKNAILFDKLTGDRTVIEDGASIKVALLGNDVNRFSILFNETQTVVKSSDFNVVLANETISVEGVSFPAQVAVSSLDGTILSEATLNSAGEGIPTTNLLNEVIVVSAEGQTKKIIIVE